MIKDILNIMLGFDLSCVKHLTGSKDKPCYYLEEFFSVIGVDGQSLTMTYKIPDDFITYIGHGYKYLSDKTPEDNRILIYEDGILHIMFYAVGEKFDEMRSRLHGKLN